MKERAPARGKAFPFADRPWLLLAAVTLLVYSSSIGNGFVWDDHEIIVDNPVNRDLSNVGLLFRSADVALSTEDNPYYRPLNRLSYLVDYHLFGLRPWAYHAENVLIHTAVVVGLFLLAARLFGAQRPALMAALLHAVHPVNSEAVNFISGRNNLLSTLFALLALLAYLRGQQSRSRAFALATGPLLLCALLCKETALMLLPVLFLCGAPSLRSPRRDLIRGIASLAPSLAAVGIYLILRANALAGVLGASLDLAGLGQRLALNLFIVPRYALNLLVPLRLSTGYALPEELTGAAGWLVPVWLAIAVGVVLLVKRGSSVTRFGLFWLGCHLLPIANIVPIPSAPMADRYLYLPAIGLWLVAADQARRLYETHRRATALCGVLLIVFLAGLTFVRNFDWRDDVTLFSSAVETEPDFPRNHYALGFAFLEREELDRAESCFSRAVEIAPAYADALVQLGYIHAVRGSYQQAERYLTAGVRANPRSAEAHFNLALLLERLDRRREAVFHYEIFLRHATTKHGALMPQVEARLEALRAD